MLAVACFAPGAVVVGASVLNTGDAVAVGLGITGIVLVIAVSAVLVLLVRVGAIVAGSIAVITAA